MWASAYQDFLFFPFASPGSWLQSHPAQYNSLRSSQVCKWFEQKRHVQVAVSWVPGTLIDWIEVESCRSSIHDVKRVFVLVKVPDKSINRIRYDCTRPKLLPGSSNLKSVFQPSNAEPFSGDQVQPERSMGDEGQCTMWISVVSLVMQARTMPRRATYCSRQYSCDYGTTFLKEPGNVLWRVGEARRFMGNCAVGHHWLIPAPLLRLN